MKKLLRHGGSLGLLLFFTLSTLLASVPLSMLVPAHASAAAGDLPTSTIQSAEFLNAYAIKVHTSLGDAIMWDSNPSNGEYHYDKVSGSSDPNICRDNNPELHLTDKTQDPSYQTGIRWLADQHPKSINAQLDINILDPGAPNAGCKEVGGKNQKIAITINHVERAKTFYEYTDGTHIQKVDGSLQFTMSQNKSIFAAQYDSGASSCKDFIQISADGSGFRYFDISPPAEDRANQPKPVDFAKTFGAGCRFNDLDKYADRDASYPLDAKWAYDPLGHTEKFGTAGSGTTVLGNNGGGTNQNTGDDNDPNTKCEKSGNLLTWILCPIFNGVADTADWLFSSFIQPFLYTSPISTDPNDSSFKIWSSFRIYGNIFLVLALLVIVFGQTIGGGLIDAYTAKKIVPRILTAAIFINLSVYIVNGLVDLTNILGGGLGQLLLAPLRASGQLSFTPNGTEIAGVFTAGFLGALLGGASIAGILTGGIIGGVFLAKAGIFLLFVVLIPAILAILGVFVTLIIRRGLILLLLLISPVAFALYCLPNTEKYFKKWWDLLFKTLMVYPIIIVIFAIADIMSVTLLNANGINAGAGLKDTLTSTTAGGVGDALAVIVAFVLQFLPLLLIPFAFKFAGGAVASLYGAVTGGMKKAGGLLHERQENAKKDMHRQMIQSRMRAYSNLGTRGDQTSGLRRGAYRFLQNRTGGYNLHAAHAAMNAEMMKEAEAQKDSGIDDEQRALTVNKQWALEHDAAALAAGQDGQHVRVRGGRRQFRTLGGRWVSEDNVDAAHQRWDGNQSMLQWSIGYEMQKAASQEEMDYLEENFGRLNQAGSGFNMNGAEMGGLWTGAAFAKQNTDRQYKHHFWNQGTGQLEVSGVAMFKEIDERQGSWQMASQSADTWTTMSQEVLRAKRVIDTGVADGEMDEAAAREVVQRGARIARSLGGGYYDPEKGQYIESIGQGASGRTKEEMENFNALFEAGDYQREVGMERRGDQSRRPGDTPLPPTGPPTPSSPRTPGNTNIPGSSRPER